MKKLTIGMACYDDVQGVFWSLSILNQFHQTNKNPEVELIVIDDMPQQQKDLPNVAALSGAKYVHKPKNKGPAHAKNSVFEEATGLYTLLLDSHVLCAPNSIAHLLHCIDADLLGNDIWSGPLINESGNIYGTHLELNWRGQFFGTWAADKSVEEKKQMQIPGMGSAFFCCKTENFKKVPFPHEYKGFAGEEIVLSELHRQAFGSKHYCISALKWQHRFLRDRPISYTLTVNDKFMNYLIGFYKCGWNTIAVADYFRRHLPADQHQHAIATVQNYFPDLLSKNLDGKVFPVLD